MIAGVALGVTLSLGAGLWAYNTGLIAVMSVKDYVFDNATARVHVNCTTLEAHSGKNTVAVTYGKSKDFSGTVVALSEWDGLARATYYFRSGFPTNNFGVQAASACEYIAGNKGFNIETYIKVNR
jgi:hypothetical protein